LVEIARAARLLRSPQGPVSIVGRDLCH